MPVCGVIFYIAEFYWAWFFTGHPWPNLSGVLWVVPAALLGSTTSMLFGAWLVTQLERANYFLPKPKRVAVAAR